VTRPEEPPSGWYRRFLDRLDPEARLGEVLFGLIMVLGFTLAAGFQPGATREQSRELLVAALGCNFAWGLIDAILYVQGQVSERGRIHRLIRRVQTLPQRAEGLAIVSREMDHRVPDFLDPRIRAEVDADVYEKARSLALEPNRVTLSDLLDGLAVFWLVFLATLPASVPFLLLRDQHLALRVSNAVLILMLFGIGWRWAGYTGASRWRTGLTMAAIGLASVGIAIPLGG